VLLLSVFTLALHFTEGNIYAFDIPMLFFCTPILTEGSTSIMLLEGIPTPL
jgi:hypothetical protein